MALRHARASSHLELPDDDEAGLGEADLDLLPPDDAGMGEADLDLQLPDVAGMGEAVDGPPLCSSDGESCSEPPLPPVCSSTACRSAPLRKRPTRAAPLRKRPTRAGTNKKQATAKSPANPDDMVGKLNCKPGRLNCLELFSGTGSIGRGFKDQGWTVTSLDWQACPFDSPDIEMNILDWNYTAIRPRTFHIIWASPPCTECGPQLALPRTWGCAFGVACVTGWVSGCVEAAWVHVCRIRNGAIKNVGLQLGLRSGRASAIRKRG